MRADNSRHIVDAARRRSEYTRAKAIQALRNLDDSGQPVTFGAVAAQALLTELGRESPQFNGHVSDLGATVSARDRRW